MRSGAAAPCEFASVWRACVAHCFLTVPFCALLLAQEEGPAAEGPGPLPRRRRRALFLLHSRLVFLEHLMPCSRVTQQAVQTRHASAAARAGNGYALLTAARALGDPRRLRQAAAFAAWGVQHLEQLEGTPDHPHSLFEGLAGFGVFCLDCMLETRGVGGAYFPGCELPGGAPAAGAARPLA